MREMGGRAVEKDFTGGHRGDVRRIGVVTSRVKMEEMEGDG